MKSQADSSVSMASPSAQEQRLNACTRNRMRNFSYVFSFFQGEKLCLVFTGGFGVDADDLNCSHRQSDQLPESVVHQKVPHDVFRYHRPPARFRARTYTRLETCCQYRRGKFLPEPAQVRLSGRPARFLPDGGRALFSVSFTEMFAKSRIVCYNRFGSYLIYFIDNQADFDNI